MIFSATDTPPTPAKFKILEKDTLPTTVKMLSLFVFLSQSAQYWLRKFENRHQ